MLFTIWYSLETFFFITCKCKSFNTLFTTFTCITKFYTIGNFRYISTYRTNIEFRKIMCSSTLWTSSLHSSCIISNTIINFIIKYTFLFSFKMHTFITFNTFSKWFIFQTIKNTFFRISNTFILLKIMIRWTFSTFIRRSID